MNKLLSFIQSFKSYLIECSVACQAPLGQSQIFRVLDSNGSRATLLVVYWAYVSCKGTRLAIFVLSRQFQSLTEIFHLEPLLSILIINDIDNTFTSNRFLLYTDHLQFFGTIACTFDVDELQFDLLEPENWCSVNCLQLNTTKCHVIRFSSSKKPIRFKYQLNNTDFCFLKTIGDFGVSYNSTLSFNDHYLYVVPTTNKALNFIFRFSKQLKTLHCSKALRFSFELFLLRYIINNFNFLSQNSELIIQLRTFQIQDSLRLSVLLLYRSIFNVQNVARYGVHNRISREPLPRSDREQYECTTTMAHSRTHSFR